MRGANPNIPEVHRAVRTSFVESGIVLELPLSRAEFAIRLLIPRAQERKICENGTLPPFGPFAGGEERGAVSVTYVWSQSSARGFLFH